MLRETFRVTKTRRALLQGRYDWVLNARRALLYPESRIRLEEFEKVIDSVAKDERADFVVESRLV